MIESDIICSPMRRFVLSSRAVRTVCIGLVIQCYVMYVTSYKLCKISKEEGEVKFRLILSISFDLWIHLENMRSVPHATQLWGDAKESTRKVLIVLLENTAIGCSLRDSNLLACSRGLVYHVASFSRHCIYYT
jgi:hypothetical protein